MFLFSILIVSCLAGNGLNVQNQLLLMPYPQEVTFEYLGTTAISANPSLSYSLPDVCKKDEKCAEFIRYNFNNSITYPLMKQTNLDDWKISLFDHIDIPHIVPEKETEITLVTFKFTAKKVEDIYPELTIDVDVSYTLDITTDGIVIEAKTVYGARYALETLLQLFRPYNGRFVIAQLPISIKDQPRFKWRGLMIDTARHSFKRSTFKKIVDAMGAIKANVLHIHLADGQQFLFGSEEYPYLSKKGAYQQEKVLTKEFIKELKEYANLRGVIVYGELDTPAHTAIWNNGYPGIVANMWDRIVEKKSLYGENIPALNPANNQTFPIIDAVMRELGEFFDTQYVHFGGDEVSTSAWEYSAEVNEIKEWMTQHNVTDFLNLEKYFNVYAQEQILGNGKTPVAWEEVYTKGNILEGTIVQVWSNPNTLNACTKDGYKAILSFGFYMDVQMPLCSSYIDGSCQDPNHMWVWSNRDMYGWDPVKDLPKEQQENVLGGEACSWDESCDDQNVFDRVFQRYSAVAERFWSAETIVDAESHEVRANYVRCIGLRRGFMKGAGPLYCSYCQLPEDL